MMQFSGNYTKPLRAWINQPSKLQGLHHMNGQCGFVVKNNITSELIFFPIDGKIVSLTVLNEHISMDWIDYSHNVSRETTKGDACE